MRDRLGSDLLSSFAMGGGAAFVVRVLGALSTLLLYLLLTRLAGEAEYGRYIYALNWVIVLVMIATLGLDTAALRYLPNYSTRGDVARLNGFIQVAPRLVAVSGAGLAALLAAVATLLRGQISPGLSNTLYTAALLLPLLALLQLAGAMLRSQRRVLAALIPQSILRPLGTIAAVGLVGALREAPLAAPATMMLDALVTGATVALAAILFRRGLPAGVEDVAPTRETRQWLRTALPLMTITSVKLAMNKTDILMVGALVDTTSSGVYALAAQMSSFIGFPLLAGNVILAPLISERHADDDREGLQALVTFAARSVSVAATILAAALLAAAPWILAVFGPAFGAAYPPLVLLVLGQLVNAGAGAVGFLLSMTGHERIAARTTVLAATLNLGLNAVLVPRFGLVGAAVATTFSGLVWNAILVRQVVRLLDVRSTILG